MKQERSIRMDENSIKLILRDLLRNLVFLILAALTAVMGVRVYYSLVYVPEYTSSATLAISAKGDSGGDAYSSLTTANAMADVFAEVFQSQVMKEKVEETAGKITGETSITSRLIPETNLLVLSVTSENPETAYTVIQAVLENYHSVSDYLFGNAVIDVIMNPQVSTAPSNPVNLRKYEKTGAAGAFCLTALLVILCSVLRNTVKTEKGATRRVEGACLGVIGHEVKNRTWKSKLKNANKGLLITNPLASFRFEEAYHKLASMVDYRMQRAGAKVLLVSSVAENEGKSTVAANLALALAERNKKVLLMDLDFKKPALYRLFDCPADMPFRFMEYLEGEEETKNLITFDKQKRIYEIFNRKPANVSRKLLKNGRLKKLMKAAGNVVDYIILDSTPIIVGVDVEILTDLADASLLVIRQDYVRISDLNDAIEGLRESNSKYLGYVLNDFSGKTSVGQYSRYGMYGKYNHREETIKQ